MISCENISEASPKIKGGQTKAGYLIVHQGKRSIDSIKSWKNNM